MTAAYERPRDRHTFSLECYIDEQLKKETAIIRIKICPILIPI